MQPYPISDSDSLELAFAGPVKAGFPSPAEEVREKLDLVKLLVQHSASTFFFRIDGISMVDADMDEGDIIIVDRGIDPYNGCKAVCFIDGEYTVKRVEIHATRRTPSTNPYPSARTTTSSSGASSPGSSRRCDERSHQMRRKFTSPCEETSHLMVKLLPLYW